MDKDRFRADILKCVEMLIDTRVDEMAETSIQIRQLQDAMNHWCSKMMMEKGREDRTRRLAEKLNPKPKGASNETSD